MWGVVTLILSVDVLATRIQTFDLGNDALIT